MSKLRTYIAVAIPLAVVAAMAACGSSSKTGESGDDDTDDSGAVAASPDGSATMTDATLTMTMTGSEAGGGGGTTTRPDGSTTLGTGDSSTGGGCELNSDCVSKICTLPAGVCASPTCSDGAQNGNETDIDCGGSCSPCAPMKMCAAPTDCTSGVCTGDVCQAPNDMDGVKNGNETGTDCGGMGNPLCPAGQGCGTAGDCVSDVCTAGLCVAAVCTDMVQNNTETDVDCGGDACPRCADGDRCLVATDCKDGVCKDTGNGQGLRCQPPTNTDGVQNGNETDVDCGGTGSSSNNACPVGGGCLATTDCQTDVCDYKHTCTQHRSCTGEIVVTKLADGGSSFSGTGYGADTCGTGGPGGDPTVAKNWESCCETIDVTVTEGTPATQRVVHLDKYKVTAGRMRAFLEAMEPPPGVIDAGVRGYIQDLRRKGQIPNVPVINAGTDAGTSLLPAAWDKYLPVSMAGDPNEPPDCEQSAYIAADAGCTMTQTPVYTSAANHVGPAIFKANSQTEQGCDYDSPGTHTYYLGNPDIDGKTPGYAQTDYDVKPLQCVDYLVAQAFCIWDGGRLETEEEWLAAWGTASSQVMPWSSSTVKDSRGMPIAGTVAGGTQPMYPKTDWPGNAVNAGVQGCTNDPGTDDLSVIGYQFCSPQTAASCTHANADGGSTRVKCDSVANGGLNENCTCTPEATNQSCQFPTVNDLTIQTTGNCSGTPWVRPDAGLSIEVAAYQYNYQYPTQNMNDFAVYIAAPGRHIGRGPSWHETLDGGADGGLVEGAADLVGDTFDVTSDISYVTDNPFPTGANPNGTNIPGVKWSGNGSWEVHNYVKGQYGPYRILDKYGKMGLRCIHN